MDQITLLKKESSQIIPQDWGELTWFASGSQGNSKEMTLGRCILRPGQKNPRHLHPNCSEILHVIQGRILHTYQDGKEVEMNVGDTITIPANLWHQAKNIGTNDAVLMIVFSSAERQTRGE